MCCHANSGSTLCEDATILCKRGTKIPDPSDHRKTIIRPKNQHTGPHWSLSGGISTVSANSVYVTVGVRKNQDGVQFEAIGAYIMPSPLEKDGFDPLLDSPGSYEIAVITSKITNREYDGLDLKNLQLPLT